VVKAFKTIFASRLGNASEGGQPLDAFYAGDDEQAKATVAQLLTSLGFRPVDAGGLRMARSLEKLAFLNIILNARNGWSWQSVVEASATPPGATRRGSRGGIRDSTISRCGSCVSGLNRDGSGLAAACPRRDPDAPESRHAQGEVVGAQRRVAGLSTKAYRRVPRRPAHRPHPICTAVVHGRC
jgi:hypothetical protein